MTAKLRVINIEQNYILIPKDNFIEKSTLKINKNLSLKISFFSFFAYFEYLYKYPILYTQRKLACENSILKTGMSKFLFNSVIDISTSLSIKLVEISLFTFY